MGFTGRNNVFYIMAVVACIGDTDLPLLSTAGQVIKIELIKMVTSFHAALCLEKILNTQSRKPGQ